VDYNLLDGSMWERRRVKEGEESGVDLETEGGQV